MNGEGMVEKMFGVSITKEAKYWQGDKFVHERWWSDGVHSTNILTVNGEGRILNYEIVQEKDGIKYAADPSIANMFNADQFLSAEDMALKT